LITTVTGLAEVLTLDLNSGLPGRDQVQTLYQVPAAIDSSNSKRAGPRDFILHVANAVNSNGTRKYHLDVALNTFVTKVNFEKPGNGSNPRAAGVNFLQGQSLYAADPRYTGASGTPGSVNASKEVIISGGAYESPKLLKLSGIGPAAELQSFGIDVLVDLPGVGTNLQDRYEVSVIGDVRDLRYEKNVLTTLTWFCFHRRLPTSSSPRTALSATHRPTRALSNGRTSSLLLSRVPTPPTASPPP
jgi:choline dehydrogenase